MLSNVEDTGLEIRKWQESRDTWVNQKKLTQCDHCGRPILYNLRLSENNKKYCADCVKLLKLREELDDLNPREGESMDDWLKRYRRYRERCQNDELEKNGATPRKKAIFRYTQ